MSTATNGDEICGLYAARCCDGLCTPIGVHRPKIVKCDDANIGGKYVYVPQLGYIDIRRRLRSHHQHTQTPNNTPKHKHTHPNTQTPTHTPTHTPQHTHPNTHMTHMHGAPSTRSFASVCVRVHAHYAKRGKNSTSGNRTRGSSMATS